MKVIIDRFEGEYALCENEDKVIISVPKSHIPKEAREGSILEINHGKYTLSEDEQTSREEHIKTLMEDLWE